jgi:hypothetical protein
LAVVKIKFIKNSSKQVQYVQRGGLSDDPESSKGVEVEKVFEGFSSSQQELQPKGSNQLLRVIQSWSDKESKMFPPEVFNEMGRKLVESTFPDHEYYIKTHTDKDHIHNHILINNVNLKTGKRIEAKFKTLQELRSASDKVCLEYGLSVIRKGQNDRHTRAPEAVKSSERYRGKSYMLDMFNKADFAIHYATNFDEYKHILKEFDIDLRITNKHITYFYDKEKRGVRGSKLESRYDKQKLGESFKLNEEKFARNPELRATFGAQIDAFKGSSKHSIRVGGDLLSERPEDHKFKRQSEGKAQSAISRSPFDECHSDHTLTKTLLPIEELKKAKRNIKDYCNEHKIPLKELPNGKTVLHGKEWVEISDFTTYNRKNKTHGNLIDFVASHRQSSYLQAVGYINKNEHILLLEKHFKEKSVSYRSFYIPKPEQGEVTKYLNTARQALGFSGTHSKLEKHLLEKNQIHFSKDGSFRVFGENSGFGSFEFSKNEGGDWQTKKLGVFKAPLFSKGTMEKKAQIFLDPKSFFKMAGDDKHLGSHKDGVLALFEPDEKLIDAFLAGNKNVKSLEIVSQYPHGPSSPYFGFLEGLKKRFIPLGIEVQNIVSLEKLPPTKEFSLSL